MGTAFNYIDNVSRSTTQLAKDTGIATDSTNKPQEDTGIIERIVQGAFGSLTTIYKAFSVPKFLIIEVGQKIGVPSIVIEVMYNVLLIIIIITIILLLFNRSDTA